MTAAAPAFRVLIARELLLLRIHELARAIARAHQGEPPCFVAVMEGARTFAQHLTRLVPGAHGFAEIRASSYGEGTVSSGCVTIGGGVVDAKGKSVVILEDIVDTGRTMDAIAAHFRAAGAREVRVCTLLSKPSRRVVSVPIEWIGFEIPDEFVIGFGMDVAGRYRELPHVAVYERALEQEAG